MRISHHPQRLRLKRGAQACLFTGFHLKQLLVPPLEDEGGVPNEGTTKEYTQERQTSGDINQYSQKGLLKISGHCRLDPIVGKKLQLLHHLFLVRTYGSGWEMLCGSQCVWETVSGQPSQLKGGFSIYVPLNNTQKVHRGEL